MSVATIPDVMRAAVIRRAGGPDALQIERVPVPEPARGEVLIRVMAFGLNRSELFTRQGHSPGVRFPRILGIEATGIVAAAPGGEFAIGDTVMTAMGGMGRDFDGGYAEYACVPTSQVRRISTTLPWETLGALPEMLQTAWGSLFTSLRLVAGQRLLVRGGTTSVGFAATALATERGARVVATTRDPARETLLREAGAGDVIVDTGAIAERVHATFPGGVDAVLELVGTTTLADSLACVGPGGIVCMTGMVGNRWSFDRFSPMEVIPTAVSLTTYAGDVDDFMRTPMQRLVDRIAAGDLHIRVGPIFRLDEIADAHRCMEDNRAVGKIVVLT